MHPGIHAANRPDARAVVMGETGAELTYRELDERSIRLANLLRSRGMKPGDHLAVLLDNNLRYFEVVWAALRSGLYVTPINWHLTAGETAYIVADCGATALVATAAVGDLVANLTPSLHSVSTRLVVDGSLDGFENYDDATAKQPTTPIDDEVEGAYMFYSSGTTGRPKGIKPPLRGVPFGTDGPFEGLLRNLYGFDESIVYLCPAPLYHAAPLGWSMSTQRIGGTVVVMERFDAEQALELIERERVTHAQFVPTHFVRMLKLPKPVRERYDVASLQKVVHAAAPCPVDVKKQMLDWWGPIIHEYYSGSEGIGYCAVGPEDWLAHPGTVGRALIGVVHIVGEDGAELPSGEVGQIWFETPVRFEYHNDPTKTRDAFNDKGWSTLGDVGYVDADGYLYLTDRISHMIISGGVNIYPQEVENVLVLHPAVADVAIIGVPHPDMGEEVKAVVELADPSVATEAMKVELIAYCRDRLAAFKCPRTVDFAASLPRLPSGKLLKRVLRDQYAASGSNSRYGD